jgi:hypothetical protein
VLFMVKGAFSASVILRWSDMLSGFGTFTDDSDIAFWTGILGISLSL